MFSLIKICCFWVAELEVKESWAWESFVLNELSFSVADTFVVVYARAARTYL